MVDDLVKRINEFYGIRQSSIDYTINAAGDDLPERVGTHPSDIVNTVQMRGGNSFSPDLLRYESVRKEVQNYYSLHLKRWIPPLVLGGVSYAAFHAGHLAVAGLAAMASTLLFGAVSFWVCFKRAGPSLTEYRRLVEIASRLPEAL